MRPFNIELWKAGKPVITRDGREVEELTYFESKKGPFKLCGTLNGLLETWTIEGFFRACKSRTDDDLFHPEPEMWVNVYNRGDIFVTGDIHNSEEECKNKILSKEQYIGTYKLGNP